MSKDCLIRFMDNQKIDDYVVENEDVNYPFVNALSEFRSKIFRTTGTSFTLTCDMTFPDKINTLIIFAPLGDPLGISKEAVIKLRADNVNVWTNPELDIEIDLVVDDKLVYFTNTELDTYYRFWQVSIEDPASSLGYIEFGYIYLGDYLTTTVRNLAPKFAWEQVHKVKESKALDGTSYFDSRYKYDTLRSTKFSYVDATDRALLQDLYNRKGKDLSFPICVDPTSIISNNKEELTKLVRFGSNFRSNHESQERYNLSMSFNEVI